MSLYNMVCGTNPAAGFLLAVISLDPDLIPRFRDAYLDDDGQHVIVYTRTGGGNREAYEDENDDLANHENYVSDCDDDFDSTYAHFKFRIPDEGIERITKELSENTDLTADQKERIFTAIKATPSTKFEAALNALKAG